ncbi:hypothetical protein [Candidatus Oleimmundimicrobium sp.]|uniref:hypothetical protein n=1 Tax=Candidatus Oleimmundimicrobium sp. TaxID=3060597 RepID=UPI002724AB39|nr:hypothetical protein [Candidatus Oleimmundimicrobium sp.]MDO8886161.1 hypothetical protein [Candidatus Oleimmundimicrobium sp.]
MILNQQPDGELIKELYARFGLAYYHSECLHRELCLIHTMGTFQKSEDITRPRVEEKLAYVFSLTLGEVTKQLKDTLPKDLFAELEDGAAKRNFLAHHFWFDSAHLMVSVTGINRIIEELNEFSQMFSDLDRRVTEHTEQKRKQLGVTDEILEKALDDVLAGKPMDPILGKRKLKKQEHLVRVWEFSLPNGTKPLIFETEDGCLWQLCDVGLGWTDYDTIGHDWHKNEIIKQYLPARINPRPKDAKTWNYEFCLKQGAVLWVKRGKQPKTFKWGIKTKDKTT